MAAKLLDDERLEDQPSTIENEQEEHVEDAVEQPTLEQDHEIEDDLPEKYRGKSAAELARMHQEAEKLLGRQSSEVGELRKVVDSYIQTQLAEKQQAPQEEDDDIDFFTDPDKAVAKAIERHPKMRQAEELSEQYKRQLAMHELGKAHPDASEIVKDEKFAAWVKASKIRTQLFIDADQKYDYDAANELFSLWKERQQIVKQTADVEKAERKQQVKAASTGNARGNPDSKARKIYRRADIIKLMKTDPDRYMAMSDEIMAAYNEGRVKS